MLFHFFRQGSLAHRAWAWGGLIVFFGHQLFQAYIAWAINGWMERFYDLVQSTAETGSGNTENRQEMRDRVYDSLWEFAIIVAPTVAVHPIAGLVRNWWVFSWRRTLMTSYLNRWNTTVPAIEGASQRVHEDTQRFASGLQSCVSTVIKSVFTLIVFCPVLYSLDPQLMGIAVGAAVGGLGVSVVIGWPLVGLEVKNQMVEAELRTKLVILETNPTSIFSAGTPFTPFIRTFRALTVNYQNLYLSFAALGAWLSIYEQVAVLLPYMLVAPRLFADDPQDVFTLGKLVKVSNAFGRVFDSLNVISERWLDITEFFSCLRRLREFEVQVNSRSPAKPSRLAQAMEEVEGVEGMEAAEVAVELAEDVPRPPVEEDEAPPPRRAQEPTWMSDL
jgi:peptide/bleomycin uptake transporter